MRDARINERIRAKEVRLIDDTGAQVGIVQIDKARETAKEKGLDLVEVAPEAKPPVCRILDYGRYRYLQKKKAHQNKSKSAQLKEIRVRLKTDEHDLITKVNKAKEFFGQGHKVQVTLLFRGREMSRRELGRKVLHHFAELLEEVAKIEMEPRAEGRRMWLILAHK